MQDYRAEFFRTSSLFPFAFKGEMPAIDAVEARAALIDFALGLPGVEMRRLANGKISFMIFEEDALGPQEAFLEEKVFLRIGGPDGLIELGLPLSQCDDPDDIKGLVLRLQEGSKALAFHMPNGLHAERKAESLIERAWACARGL